jgi:hypothetical protein
MNTPEHWLERRRKYQESVQKSSLSAGWQGLNKTSILGPGTKQYRDTMMGLCLRSSSNILLVEDDTKKGQKIWSNRFSGTFDSDCAAKVFLSKLTEEEQCSTMFWGYSHNFRAHGFQFTTDFDGHTYFNECSAKGANTQHHYLHELDKKDYGLPHILSLSLPHSASEDKLKRRNAPGPQGLYATRDILPGEELCFDYHDIHRVAIFDYYGLLWAHALHMHQWFAQ